MKYIESKLNPDGRTYDHSEVIEAHKNGASAIEFYDSYDGKWVDCGLMGLVPEILRIKYRAVIEDGLESEVAQLKEKLLLAEGNLELASMSIPLTELIRQKFLFGDDTITLTRAEVNEVFPGLLK